MDTRFTLYEYVESPVLVVDGQGSVIFWNRYGEKLTGYRMVDVMGRNYFEEMTLPVVQAQSVPASGEALQTCHTTSRGLIILTWSEHPVFNSDGKLIYKVMTGHEITGERTLSLELRRYQSVMDSIGDGVYIADSERKIIYINPAFIRITGFESYQVMGKNFRILRSRQISGDILEEIERIISKGESWSGEIENRNNMGNSYYCQESVTPVRLPDDTINYVAVIRDISEQKRNHLRIHESEKRYRTLIESIHEGVFIAEKGSIVFSNQSLCDMMNLAPRNFQGLRIEELVHIDDSSSRNLVKKYSSDNSKELTLQFQFRLNRRDGAEVYAHIRMTRMLMNGQNSVIGSVQDVTAIFRRYEEKARHLEDVQNSLRYANNLIENAPVGAWVLDFSDYVKDPADPADFFHESCSFRIRTNSVNQKLLEIFRMDRSQMAHVSFVEPSLISEEKALEVIKELRDLRNGRSVSFETIFLREGREIPVLVEAIPVERGPGDVVTQVMAMVLDMTERKWLEEQIRKSEAELKWTLKKLFQANQTLEDNFKKMETISTTDEMTGVPNRRRFQEFLGHEWRRSIRKNLPISLVLFDVDYFKYFNDTYGHQGGDDCLKQVASAMNDKMNRTTDLFARYGGEEFVAVLPETDMEGAMVVAERLRVAVEDLRIENIRSDEQIVTMSIGVASVIPVDEMEYRAIVETADHALYHAKENGRNQAFAIPLDPENLPDFLLESENGSDNGSSESEVNDTSEHPGGTQDDSAEKQPG